MPLYKRITIDDHTKILIWKIEESFEDLSKDVVLTSYCRNRVENMKSEMHRKGFMSIRHLLKELGYADQDLWYDEFGKPHLKDGKHISITHSFCFSAVILSDKHPVGIDIEKKRDKILRIAHKFTPLEEYHTLANDEAVIRKLTIVWCAKESLYKLYGRRGLLFLDNIYVNDFDFEEEKTTARITCDSKVNEYVVHFMEFEGFGFAYAY